MQYEVINLCPHDVNIVDGPTYPKSGDVARVAERPGQPLEGLPFPATTAPGYGKVTGLPAPTPGKLYIVSGMVAAACPGRADVFAPGESVRGTEGRIVGVRNLKQAPRSTWGKIKILLRHAPLRRPEAGVSSTRHKEVIDGSAQAQ